MPNIVIRSDDTTETYVLPAGSPLFELDHVLIFGCRRGACGRCTIQILSGHENLSSIKPAEKCFLEILAHDPNKYRLACQCKLFGDITIKQ